ncbi:MAG: molecular chaperone HtpG [Spirochaetales bacterium]|nr:molecular chaperone HtpG [Spirochaetales bacterium]
MSNHKFKTEVSQLLNLIIHSLYSHKEIFLRELISNSSDALDKLKFLTLTDDNFKSYKFDPRIDIKFSEENKTLEIIDTGIGMDEEDLNKNLGTIANSGTKNFLKNLDENNKKDSNLIGQFGVGFYSCFMVADKVEVISRKAGTEQAFKWTSDGKGEYKIENAETEKDGTRIILHLNENGSEYTSKWSIESLIKKYSDHIAFPIFLEFEDTKYDDKDEDKEPTKETKIEQVNSAAALWKRAKTEISDEEYKEFYKTISHDFDEPLHYMHTKAEGSLEYSTLFFIPKKAPFDMYQADYKPGVKLYVKRVFITDDNKELLPPYLRFVRGIIDSEDLPLNVSREILQQNRVMASIKNKAVKKILSEIKELADKDAEKFKEFVENYNRPMKEGLYSDYSNKDAILEIVRFKSTMVDGYTSLAEYKERMLEDQKNIYYITGSDENLLRKSPLLKAYKEKGYEVLIADDDIDEIIIPSIFNYKEIPLKAINKSGADDELKSDDDKKAEKDATPVIDKIKEVLGDKVKDVKADTGLGDSPSAVIADENDPSAQMAHILKAMGQSGPEAKPILKVNIKHPLLEKYSTDSENFEDLANILLDQALMREGLALKDPANFIDRINKLIV